MRFKQPAGGLGGQFREPHERDMALQTTSDEVPWVCGILPIVFLHDVLHLNTA